MDLTTDNTSPSNVYYNSYGEISDLFSSPVIPKIVIVGLNDEIISDIENLILFKEMLVKAFENLFIIDFQEQVINFSK